LKALLVIDVQYSLVEKGKSQREEILVAQYLLSLFIELTSTVKNGYKYESLMVLELMNSSSQAFHRLPHRPRLFPVRF